MTEKRLNENKKIIHLSQTIEQKLDEAEEAIKEGKTVAQNDVWAMLSEKHGFELL